MKMRLSWFFIPCLTVFSYASDQPNILLIMADDLGFSYLGCYGGEIQTPHLDQLSVSGIRYTQMYNTARCWPTRGALLTGYYAQQIRRDMVPGVPDTGNRGKRQAWAKLLPELLGLVGYRSYHTGKWHIDGMPLEQGFDRSFYLQDQGRFFNPTRLWKDDVQLPPVQPGTGFYATTALADHAIEVLEEHAIAFADRPFFHYLAFAAPHFTLHAPAGDIAVYDDRYTVGWDVIRAMRWEKMERSGLLDPVSVPHPSAPERKLGPPYHFPEALEILGTGEINRPVPWEQLTSEQKAFQAKKMAIHAAMIHRMDIEIGRIFDQLRKMGEWENTLVIFLSDNGASAEIMVRDDGHDPSLAPGSAGTYLCLGPGWSTVANTPFRRHKTWTHEGGIATPFIVSWPARIKGQGAIRRTPGHVDDVVPTLLELAGGEFHPEAPLPPGHSLVPTFFKETENPHNAIWWLHDGHRAIRMGDWKAVSPENGPWELYDLSTDRIESKNLSDAYPEKLTELTMEWDRRMKEYREIAELDRTRP